MSNIDAESIVHVPYFSEGMDVSSDGSRVTVRTDASQFERYRTFLHAHNLLPEQPLAWSSEGDVAALDTMQLRFIDPEAAQYWADRIHDLVDNLTSVQGVAAGQA